MTGWLITTRGEHFSVVVDAREIAAIRHLTRQFLVVSGKLTVAEVHMLDGDFTIGTLRPDPDLQLAVALEHTTVQEGERGGLRRLIILGTCRHRLIVDVERKSVTEIRRVAVHGQDAD